MNVVQFSVFIDIHGGINSFTSFFQGLKMYIKLFWNSKSFPAMLVDNSIQKRHDWLFPFVYLPCYHGNSYTMKSDAQSTNPHVWVGGIFQLFSTSINFLFKVMDISPISYLILLELNNPPLSPRLESFYLKNLESFFSEAQPVLSDVVLIIGGWKAEVSYKKERLLGKSGIREKLCLIISKQMYRENVWVMYLITELYYLLNTLWQIQQHFCIWIQCQLTFTHHIIKGNSCTLVKYKLLCAFWEMCIQAHIKQGTQFHFPHYFLCVYITNRHIWTNKKGLFVVLKYKYCWNSYGTNNLSAGSQ